MIRFNDIQAWAYAVLLCGLMQTFFLCLIGDILFEKASLISTSLYLTKWYEMKLEDQQRILIMIAMAQKPYGIKAAGLVDVSFYTFIEVFTKASLFFHISYKIAILFFFTDHQTFSILLCHSIYSSMNNYIYIV